MLRNDVYELIDGERDYQDKRFPAGVSGISASPEGFLLVVQHVLNQAIESWSKTDVPKDDAVAMSFLRKIGATTVRAMEQHGAIPRSL